MDLRKLKKLIDLVEESGIAELEVTEGEEKVRITRGLMSTQMQAIPQMMTVPAAPAAVADPWAVPAGGACDVAADPACAGARRGPAGLRLGRGARGAGARRATSRGP